MEATAGKKLFDIWINWEKKIDWKTKCEKYNKKIKRKLIWKCFKN